MGLAKTCPQIHATFLTNLSLLAVFSSPNPFADVIQISCLIGEFLHLALTGVGGGRQEVPAAVPLEVVRAVALVRPRRVVAVEVRRDGLPGVAGHAARVGELQENIVSKIRFHISS